MDIKKIFRENKTRIGPALNLTKRCLEDVIEMRKKPNYIDYLNLAFSFKENFENAYNLKDPYNYFNNPKWKFITSDSMGLVICNLIQDSLKSRIVPVAAVDSVAAFIAEVEGIKFGWVMYEDEKDKKLYVEKSAEMTYTAVLEKVFWDTYASHRVVLGMREEESGSKIYIRDDEKNKEFIPTKLASFYVEDIQDYLRNGFTRSILFYGPPGSGKSNLVKNICSQLRLRTIRINNISQLSTDTVSEIIRIFNPDAIILEDIDNIPSQDVSQMLDKIENFNKHKLLFATANKLSRLDNATMRPERFDKVERIFKLEQEITSELVCGDEEIYNIVKDWPAVSITELMKRVKVKGKVNALANMQDLVDRVRQINSTNYDLKNKIDENEEDCDEDEDENDFDFPVRATMKVNNTGRRNVVLTRRMTTRRRLDTKIFNGLGIKK